MRLLAYRCGLALSSDFSSDKVGSCEIAWYCQSIIIQVFRTSELKSCIVSSSLVVSCDLLTLPDVYLELPSYYIIIVLLVDKKLSQHG